jgi:hypothetical protein
VPDSSEEGLLQCVLELGRTIPAPTIELLCGKLEQTGSGSAPPDIGGYIGEPAIRESTRQLIIRWAEAHPGNGFGSLAWALRAAGSMDQWWRENHRLAVAWTGPAPPGGTFRRTDQALLQIIGVARKELWLVSFAGYNLPAVRDALVAAAERDVNLHLIIESPEESQGKVTFSALQGLGKRLAEIATVYVWPLEKRAKNEKGQTGSLHVPFVCEQRESHRVRHEPQHGTRPGDAGRGSADPSRPTLPLVDRTGLSRRRSSPVKSLTTHHNQDVTGAGGADIEVV